MKLHVPAVQDAADALHDLEREGVRVYHYVAPEVVGAAALVGVGLLALAFAVVFTSEGSRVAAQTRGRRVN